MKYIVIAICLLIGCQHQPSKIYKKDVENSIDVSKILRYKHLLRSMSKQQFEHEIRTTESRFRANPTIESQIKYALVLMADNSSISNSESGLKVFTQLKNTINTDQVHLLDLVIDYSTDIVNLNTRLRNKRLQLKKVQREKKALEAKIHGLTNLERSLIKSSGDNEGKEILVK